MVMTALEAAYYISFIVFTLLLVIYAAKTYWLQSKKEYDLYCKICIIEETNRGNNFAIEIYNCGNMIAKSIQVFIEDDKIVSIDFIKPNESYVIPIGGILLMPTPACVLLYTGRELMRGEDLKIRLHHQNVFTEYLLNTDILFVERDPSVMYVIAHRISKLSFIEEVRSFRTK